MYRLHDLWCEFICRRMDRARWDWQVRLWERIAYHTTREDW
jgi:hypothetical protein